MLNIQTFFHKEDKLNYFRKQSHHFTYFKSKKGNDKDPKWQLNAQQANSMSNMLETSVLSTAGQFENILFTLGNVTVSNV